MYTTIMDIKSCISMVSYLCRLARRSKWKSLEINENQGNGERGMYNTMMFILGELKPEQREIIENDFLYVKDRNWYMDYYSKSTYYRNRKEALKNIAAYF